MPLAPRVAAYDHLLVDLDGCLWVGESVVAGSAEAVQALREAGKGLVFLTNNVSQSPEEIVRRLWRLGFRASLSEVLSVGSAVQFLLAGRDGGSAFVIGSQAFVDHVAEAGLRVVNGTPFASRADVVAVADHEGFDYRELRTGIQAVLRGAELIGAHRDPTYPMPDGPWPGTGAILAAIEAGAGRQADLTVGKPEPGMYEAARERLGPGRMLGVGDRLDVDVAGARRAGLDTALVLTGAASAADADAADPPPTHVAASLAALVLGPSG